MDYYFYSIIILSCGIFFDTLHSLYYYSKYYSDFGIFSIDFMFRKSNKDFYSKLFVFFKPLINNKTFCYLLILRLILSLLLIVFVENTYYLIFVVFVIQLLFNLRNRVALSGADQMRTIILFGLSIISINNNFFFEVGSFFIIIQLYISYFFTGYNKLKSPVWRNGNALIWVLNSNLFGNKIIQKKLIDQGQIFNIALCWGVILFQITFPLLASFSHTVVYVLIIGIIFHTSLAALCNLNDFFWSYLSSYPLVYFFSIKFNICDYLNIF
ncbi:hypothetical protein BBH99_00220 [Chryseobacterium contaminans]|uniref:HTTM-like domain-containing protein n=1 Tax=Chryseobacterium contaminans TaxID=1423959 RepID=A0A1M6VMM4_9FLAO|nr:hypothetical protein BBH99_00220 [Chryseobacterium contaminans]SHK82604.1 hypothetical protein SAMN05444407_101277 [Chryseobacterium contaminans]